MELPGFCLPVMVKDSIKKIETGNVHLSYLDVKFGLSN
jgi:hypothetical protein